MKRAAVVCIVLLLGLFSAHAQLWHPPVEPKERHRRHVEDLRPLDDPSAQKGRYRRQGFWMPQIPDGFFGGVLRGLPFPGR